MMAIITKTRRELSHDYSYSGSANIGFIVKVGVYDPAEDGTWIKIEQEVNTFGAWIPIFGFKILKER